LAQALATLLKRLWPELTLLPSVQDGTQALERALADLPDVCFLDIQMPERNGLEVAETLAELWPQDRPLPRIVFVTAYDEYAVAAFERAAVDYVLKPVQADRLAKTCIRLQERLRWQISHADTGHTPHTTDAAMSDEPCQDNESAVEDIQDEDSALLSAVRALSGSHRHAEGESPAPQTPLRLIQVAVGNHLQMIPVQDVLYFEAADKYVRVVTRQAEGTTPELLIRTPHGRLRVHVHGRTETLEVSRMYATLFRAM
jgi:DNA-binding LytR/AlgR family response regulator